MVKGNVRTRSGKGSEGAAQHPVEPAGGSMTESLEQKPREMKAANTPASQGSALSKPPTTRVVRTDSLSARQP